LVSYPELILLDLSEDNPLRRPIETIKSSGEKAAAVVQDLLTLSRRSIMTPAVVNLNDIVQEYMRSPEFGQLKSYHPNLKVHLQLDSELGNIKGSRVHLSKTLMNLVTNAAEAMPAGGTVTIATYDRYVDTSIRGYEDVQEGDYAIMVVADTGFGIPADDVERIFEPFFSRKTQGRSGTGLGMAVVWGTMKDHGGYIDVASVEGQGTTFTLYFPLTRDRIEQPLLEVPLEAYQSRGETILVVDDVETQRQIGAQMLRLLGYVVHIVSSGEMAIEYLREHAVDLIVLDMLMPPGMNGLETYRQAVLLHPGQKAVITSGFSESDLVRDAQNLGAGRYVRKPFALAKIAQAVRQELDKPMDADGMATRPSADGRDSV
jgi:two-component system cell cycle sensor histidine kinase/response regulator CckA